MAGFPLQSGMQFFFPPNQNLIAALAAGGMNPLSPAAGSLNLQANLWGWTAQPLPTYGIPGYNYLGATGLSFMDPTAFIMQGLGMQNFGGQNFGGQNFGF